VFELWRSHPQMMAVLIDKMLRTQIVTCAAVANWIFIPAMKNEITKFYVWEILHGTIGKMEKHVAKLVKELDEAKALREKKNRKSKKAMRMDGAGSGDSSSSSSEEERDLDANLPTEEEMDRLEERLESAQSEQKNLFLIVFQRFIMVLTEHLASCESRGVDFMTPWFKWVLERLQNVFLAHHPTVFKYISTLESLLFTSDVDPHILEVFQQFCALRA
jgi:nuclear cap-binding protein subunit 1